LHVVIHKLKVNKYSSRRSIHFDCRINKHTVIIRKRRFHGRFWLFPMSEGQTGPYDAIARRWLALVERRQQHLIELCDSGRWRHYYTHGEFLEEMRKVLRIRDQWAAIAGLPLSDEMAIEDDAPPEEYFRSSFQEQRKVALPTTPWPD